MKNQHIAFAVPGDLTTLTGGYIYDRRLMQELSALGWTVDHIQLPDSFPAPSAQDLDTALKLLEDLRPDCPVIIDGLAFGALDPVRVARIESPIVALVHHPLAKENGLSPDRQNVLFETERQNLTHADWVIVPSPHTAEILSDAYGVPDDKITIAQPGIDQPEGASTPLTPPLIMSVGIQLPRKGHDVLLRALAQVSDLPWQAQIIGAALDEDYAQELVKLRHQLNMQDRVMLCGQVERDALDTLYRKARIFALATRYEGYGIVFNEALVHGLPIVSCATGAVSDTVPDSAGFLVPTDDPGAFAEALRTLLSDTATYETYANASRHSGRLLPGWDNTADTVSQMLKRAFNTSH